MTSERPGDLIERTRQMYQTVLGASPELTDDFSAAFAALVDGSADIVVEIPWDERWGEEMLDRHQVVLHGLSDDQTRLTFYNPAAPHGLEAGTEIGGRPGEGPPRRVEAEGMQSMELSLMARWFAEGKAQALIPPAGMFE
ncbi:MAG: hypothetical protein EB084_03735 [Proteobacteria bacterium]|nr:hypothetical protein [Pseudomonadota bacterium]